MPRQTGIQFTCDHDGVTAFEPINETNNWGVEFKNSIPTGWHSTTKSAPPGEERDLYFCSDWCAMNFFNLKLKEKERANEEKEKEEEKEEF